MGSGKTTTARILSEKYSSNLLCEETKLHPFISDFYVDQESYSFETELNFLIIHYHQLMKAEKAAFFASDVYSDFLFDKDWIFASVTLNNNPQEYKLFLDLFSYLKSRIRRPDLVVYLKAPSDLIFERIRKRGRVSEKNIEFAYIDTINSAYDRFFRTYKEAKVKVVDVSDIDNVSEDELARVIDVVRSH
jgi:deoxyguanosine kinase